MSGGVSEIYNLKIPILVFKLYVVKNNKMNPLKIYIKYNDKPLS